MKKKGRFFSSVYPIKLSIMISFLPNLMCSVYGIKCAKIFVIEILKKTLYNVLLTADFNLNILLISNCSAVRFLRHQLLVFCSYEEFKFIRHDEGLWKRNWPNPILLLCLPVSKKFRAKEWGWAEDMVLMK